MSGRTCYNVRTDYRTSSADGSKCGGEGHLSRECTQERAPQKCYNVSAVMRASSSRQCGEAGHLSRDCTSEAVEGSGPPPRAPKSCYNVRADGCTDV